MAEAPARLRRPSLATKVLLFSTALYLLLTLLILAVWNLGVPALGVPGRLPEQIGMEVEAILSGLADKELLLSSWLSARRVDAEALGRIDGPSPELEALAASKRPDASAEALRLKLEARYAALSLASSATSRALVVRREDGLVLVDGAGISAGSFFPRREILGQRRSGQFRIEDELYTFSAAQSPSGIWLDFVLVAPMGLLFDRIQPPHAETANWPNYAFADEKGRLIGPLPLRDASQRIEAGELPLGLAELERLAASGKAELLRHGAELLNLAAAKVSLAGGQALFILAAASRDATLAGLVQDSAAMALLAFLLAAAASFLTLRHLRIILSPLARLHAAVEAFGRSEPFELPAAAEGEVGEITRAFATLAAQVSARRSELETTAELRSRMLRLTAELCGIYARDDSEAATVAATNSLKRSFKADAAALFYDNAKQEYRFCLAGADLPIALPEERWRACVSPLAGPTEIARFGPWSPPGMDSPLPAWIAYRLYASGSVAGYIFLGKAAGHWSEEEEMDLVDIARTIAPIVQVRRERRIQEEVRREAEEKLASNERRLRTFLEGSRDMIYTADSEDIVTDINAAGLALLRYRDKDEIIGKPFSSFALDAGDRDMLLDRVRKVGYAADYEIVLKRADGSGVFCLETVYAIREPSGRVLELMGISKDITERISSESALWKTNLELADANIKIQRTQALMIQHEKLASIGQLAAGIAHEINNPLSFLKSNHEMLEKYAGKIREAWEAAISPATPATEAERLRSLIGNRFSEIDEMLRESDEGFERIKHIVGSLKSFSRNEQGADFEPYDVNAGIESSLAMTMNEIKYVAEIKKNLGNLPLIRAHRSEINQVILNILVNAAQAIEGQGRSEKGLIEIRSLALGDKVVIGIRDDGPGIPESLRLKIFDPFFTTKAPGKGTGLGLSISYDIVVSKHGGRLEVDSAPGLGTTFTIELPVAGPEEAEELLDLAPE